MENSHSFHLHLETLTNLFTFQGFVIVSALLVTALLQFIFDGKPPSHYCLMALPLVMTSIFIYQKYPYADRKKKD
jgi:solute carrier family 35 (UDP-sugar transporter), member A1/2/3